MSVLHTLENMTLTLLSPKLWDDKNDSFYLDVYKRRKGVASVLAACLTAASETYHHWKVFGGDSGACIVFHKRALIEQARRCGLNVQQVIYKTNAQMEELRPHPVAKLPFYKRYAFRDEKEWRIIYENPAFDVATQPMPITCDMIERIVVNPWTPRELAQSFATAAKKLDGCGGIRFQRSALVDNEVWQGLIGDATIDDEL